MLWHNCYSMTTDAIYNDIGHSKFLLWQQLNVAMWPDPSLVSQATPFVERGGRVWSRCNHWVVATTETCHDQSDPRSLLITSVVMEYNYITTCLADVSIYYLTAMIDNCVPWRQLGSYIVTRPFLSLWRGCLARLCPVLVAQKWEIKMFLS